MRIVVYTKPNCSQCAAVKRWLADHQTESVELPADQHAKFLTEVLEAKEAPVIVIETDTGSPVAWTTGFRPDWLQRNFGDSIRKAS